jgi:acetylcholinesterase
LTALGFLAGREVKEAGIGNLGLLDRALFGLDLLDLVCMMPHLQSVRAYDGCRDISLSSVGILIKSPCELPYSHGYLSVIDTVWNSWGQSAGAISVALQMIANDGDNEGLFRGAFMMSGSPIPVGAVDSDQGQLRKTSFFTRILLC